MSEPKAWAIGFLVLVGLLVAGLALIAEPVVTRDLPPSQTVRQANVGEQRITLTDGRTVLCLTFDNPRLVTCDWPTAHLTAN